MATITKRLLSGSTNGRLVQITAVATPGDVVHTATALAGAENNFDEIWLFAVNSDTTARKLTTEYGGAAAPADLIEQTIPAEGGLAAVIPGLLLQNTLIMRCFAAAANVVNVGGFVNRITP